jgi:hypothetical protein
VTPKEIIEKAKAAGVALSLDDKGGLRIAAKTMGALDGVGSLIQENRRGIINFLKNPEPERVNDPLAEDSYHAPQEAPPEDPDAWHEDTVHSRTTLAMEVIAELSKKVPPERRPIFTKEKIRWSHKANEARIRRDYPAYVEAIDGLVAAHRAACERALAGDPPEQPWERLPEAVALIRATYDELAAQWASRSPQERLRTWRQEVVMVGATAIQEAVIAEDWSRVEETTKRFAEVWKEMTKV